MSFLYLTADRIGTETGGGLVTKHESDALKSLGAVRVISRAEIKAAARDKGVYISDPWGYDDIAETLVPDGVTLCHAYAGTFGKTVKKLKDAGAKVCYTIAAHDRFVSREEHERLGLLFPYTHLTDEPLWQRYIEGYRLADVIVCPGTVPAATVRAYGPEFASKRIEIIPHGCEIPEHVAPLPQSFVLGYCGVSGADKGLVYLLQAWKKLAYKDAMLVIGGSGSMSPFMYQLVDHFGGGNIHLAGWQTDMSRFYNGLSCYVQPSACLLPGSPVFTKHGIVAIESLTSDDEVLADKGCYQKVIAPLKRRYHGELVVIRATGINEPVRMTPEHRVLAIRRRLDTRVERFNEKVASYKEAWRLHSEDGLGGRLIAKKLNLKEALVKGWIYYGCKPEGKGVNESLRESSLANKPEWIDAGSVEKGDIVLFPRLKDVVPLASVPLPKRQHIGSIGNRSNPLPDSLTLDDEAMRFMGYYVAEGCAATNGSVAFCFHAKEQEYIADITRMATRLGLHSATRYHKQKQSAIVWIYNTLLAKFLGDTFGRGAHNKTIPGWVMSLPAEQLRPFMQGAWRGDGSAFTSSTGRFVCSYSTVSRSLAYQMFAVMVKLGSMPKVNVNPKRGYSVSCNGMVAARFAREILGIESNFSQKADCPRTAIDDDFYYMPVIEVGRMAYSGNVYNLEVEGRHCYSAPFIVHNSEGFGIEVLEALAHGRPAICSTGAGACDMLENEYGLAGLRVPARDVDTLAAVIDGVKAEGVSGMAETGMRCREVAKKFTWDKIRERYCELWRSML